MRCAIQSKDGDPCYRIYLYPVSSFDLRRIRLSLEEYIFCHPNFVLLACSLGIAATLLAADFDVNQRMTRISSGIEC
jgi:hypothetical protein